MNRPSYVVVSSVVALLGVSGLLLKAAGRWLPSVKSPPQKLDGGDFAAGTVGQRVLWHTLTPESMALAKRLDRPIFLAIGTAWSFDARLADRQLFTDDDVASYLNRNFVCIRVDADLEPNWLPAMLPVTRLQLAIAAGFQIVFLDPGGRLFDVIGDRGAAGPDTRAFIDELIAASLAYQNLKPGDVSPQESEVRQLEAGSMLQMPDHAQATDALIAQIAADGGFKGAPGRGLRSRLWRFLMAMGETDAVHVSLDPVLRSSIVDWIDGGFFRRSSGPGWAHINFDKLSVVNSEMMTLLADASYLYQNPFYERLAKNTFESLDSDMQRKGYAVTALVGDEDERGRSGRRSFTTSEIQPYWDSTLLSATESRWAVDHLNLNPATNADMVIQVHSVDDFSDPTTSKILTKLRDARKKVYVASTTMVRADVNGTVSAAMSRCARLWGDPYAVRARPAFDRLSGFAEGVDIRHQLTSNLNDVPFLGDYLSYADAMLQHFLLTGHPSDLERGQAVLLRAIQLFDQGGKGIWRSGPGSTTMEGVPFANSPELVDNVGESNVGRAIRLCQSYGRLVLDRPAQSAPLLRSCSGATFRYGRFGADLRQGGGGFLLSTLSVADDRHAVVVGPDCVEQAADLARRVPTRFVAPAVGNARLDLQARPAGVYLVSGMSVSGPMSVPVAAERLPAVFNSVR